MEVTLEVAGQLHDLVLVQGKPGWRIEVDGEALEAKLEPNGTGVLVRFEGRSVHVELGPDGAARIDGRPVAYRIQAVQGTPTRAAAGAGHAVHVRPPMNGKLERVLVVPGQQVAKGDVLFVLEAMKMHNEVKAPAAGRVSAVHLATGATVEPRQVVLDLAPL